MEKNATAVDMGNTAIRCNALSILDGAGFLPSAVIIAVR